MTTPIEIDLDFSGMLSTTTVFKPPQANYESPRAFAEYVAGYKSGTSTTSVALPLGTSLVQVDYRMAGTGRCGVMQSTEGGAVELKEMAGLTPGTYVETYRVVNSTPDGYIAIRTERHVTDSINNTRIGVTVTPLGMAT